MAAGEYVSVHSQADTEKADIERERKELKADDAGERRELTAIYVARGLAPQLAKQVAEQLMAHDALGAHVRDELGISQVMNARPTQAAFASAASFALGAAVPLLVTMWTPRTQLPVWVAGTSLAFLAVLGATAARAGGAKARSGRAARQLLGGARDGGDDRRRRAGELALSARMLNFTDVAIRRGTRLLFSAATFSLFRGEKVGITGANGSGKSSLLGLVQGELQPDAGNFEMPSQLQIAHVSQELAASDRQAIEFVLDGDAELRTIEARHRDRRGRCSERRGGLAPRRAVRALCSGGRLRRPQPRRAAAARTRVLGER